MMIVSYIKWKVLGVIVYDYFFGSDIVISPPLTKLYSSADFSN